MRKQYHFKKVSSDVYIWDVDKLIELSKSLPVEYLELSKIKELNENFWYQYPEDVPTCKSICSHFILMQETNLNYPIILNEDGSVMDGMHRVCKAYILKEDKIKVKIFKKMPEPDYRNKHPNELEY